MDGLDAYKENPNINRFLNVTGCRSDLVFYIQIVNWIGVEYE